MRKILSLFALLMLSGLWTFAQTHAVSGTVKDNTGAPVPFATITETGTKHATTADANGAYTIKIHPDAKLTFTASGHAAQTITPEGNEADAVLAVTSKELSTVVVTTAYGMKRDQRVTPYSSQVIGDKDLHIIPQTNINSALAGKIAGVQFRGQSPMKLDNQGFLRIRGSLGLTGDIAPVYVIDGTPTASFDIDPDDVQDVTVLKGANATALFGDIAKGGAIVINTKKAAPGRSEVEVNQGFTFDNVSILPVYQNKYGGGSSSDFLQFQWQPGMPDAWQPLNGKYFPDYTDDASWGPRMTGQEYIPWYAWNPNNPESGTTAKWVPQPNNARDFYNTGVTSNTNVSFSKSGQGSSIKISYTNSTIDGLIPNSKSVRNTIFTTLSENLGDHFTASMNFTYTNNIINGQFNDAYANQSSGSFDSWFHRDLDMSKLREYKDILTPAGTYMSWNLGSNPTSASQVGKVYKGNYWYNYYSYFDALSLKQNRDHTVGNVSLTYKLNHAFKITGSLREDATTTRYENIVPSILQSSGSQTGVLASYSTGTVQGQGLGGSTPPNTLGFDVVATYSNSFVDNKLNVNLSAGASDVRSSYYSNEESTVNGLNTPNLYAISNSAANPTITNNRYKFETRAVFGSGDIEWNKIVDVSFALRNDWYSVLLPTNNSLLSPSAGVSFFFSDFTKNSLPWLSFGKLYGSWGKKPTSGLNPYATNFTYTINQNKWNSSFLTATPNTAIDPNIQGALITSYEAGLSLRFVHNRYGLNVNYYNESSENAPYSLAISGYSGFTSYLTNISKIARNGIEIQADADIVRQKNFTWNVTTTFSKILSDKIVSTDSSYDNVQISAGAYFSGIVPPKVYQLAPVLQDGDGNKVTGANGNYVHHEYTWGQLVGTAIKRNSAGLPEIDPNSLTYATENFHDFGSVLPTITGGLVNTFTYKNFILNFSIDYQVGGKFFSLSEMWGTYSGLLAPTAATNDKGMNVRDPVSLGGGVHVVGVSSVDEKTPVDGYVDAQDYFHGLGGGNAISDYFVHSLTYVKLRELSVGYNVPTDKFMKAHWIKGITVTATARNPWMIYRETQNFDPSEISGVYGEDGQFPGTRGFGFDVRLNF